MLQKNYNNPMQFLTDKDVAMTIDDDNLNEVISNKEYLKDEAEKRALTTIDEYLSSRYDMEWELRPYIEEGTSGAVYEDYQRVLSGTSGTESLEIYVNGTSGEVLPDDRNYSLLTIALDLFKYEIFQRVAPRALNQIVADRHDLAIKKLTDANRGRISIDLRPKYDTSEGNQDYLPFRYGQSWQNARMKY
jgi:hypothetical protein